MKNLVFKIFVVSTVLIFTATTVCLAGPNKVYKLEQYLQTTSKINWSESYAYADSKTDIALLKRFGHPVATYPDESLRQYAENHGWEIIS